MPSTYVSRSGRLSVAARRFSPIGSRVEFGKSVAKTVKKTPCAPPAANRQVKIEEEEEPELIQPEDIKTEIEEEPVAINCRTTAKKIKRTAEKDQKLRQVKRSQELVHIQPEEIKMEMVDEEEPEVVVKDVPIKEDSVESTRKVIVQSENPKVPDATIQQVKQDSGESQPSTATIDTNPDVVQGEEEEESVHDFLSRIRREVQAMDEGYKQMEHERRQTEILDSLFHF